jgi:Tfp pilus assembly protein PilN
MSDFLALDWDDQQLVAVAAHVSPNETQLRKWLRFEWTADDRPSEHPAEAGKRLRQELDRAGIHAAPVLVSVPREEAIVRLLELPECSDDELPGLVRFQAQTRATVPLDKLLLDFLPLPSPPGVAGRRALLVTLGKPLADRVEAVLAAAKLNSVAIGLSSVGTAELISHQPAPPVGDPSLATLIVSCIGPRIEITATCRQQILMMHAASLSSHEPPDAQVANILGETSRATVALMQTVPGIRIGNGWVLGSAELKGLPEALRQRLGVDVQVLETPFNAPGVRADFDVRGPHAEMAASPVGLLLGREGRQVDSIDFLNPRRPVVKPDRRRMWQLIGGGSAVALIIAVLVGVEVRVTQLDRQIARLKRDIDNREKALKGQESSRDKATSLEEWQSRDVDWIAQFERIRDAMGDTSKLHFTTFDAKVTNRGPLALVDVAGKARAESDVFVLEDRLAEPALGYKVRSKEILHDEKDPDWPQRFEMGLEVIGPPKDSKSKPAPVTPMANQGLKAVQNSP